MHNNIRRNAAMKRGPGNPFKRGHDPRRNTAGQRSSAAVAVTKAIRDLLVSLGTEEITAKEKGKNRTRTRAEWLAWKLYDLALQGDLRAIEIILDRVEGKVPYTAEPNLPPENADPKFILEIVPVENLLPKKATGNDTGSGRNHALPPL